VNEADTFLTLKERAESSLTEKKSRFIAIAVPVKNLDEVKAEIEAVRKKYYDARHVCWAYMLGHERKNFRANDDGEPSGTAGKPVLGQINSNGLTDVLVLVVRYFGGIKLGTSGLIAAYKGAAAEAIAGAEIIRKTVDRDVFIRFEYTLMNDVMKIIKDIEPEIVSQQFDTVCRMSLRIRQSLYAQLVERMMKVDGIKIKQL
jgi:uncharacterized YigZ family protein